MFCCSLRQVFQSAWKGEIRVSLSVALPIINLLKFSDLIQTDFAKQTKSLFCLSNPQSSPQFFVVTFQNS